MDKEAIGLLEDTVGEARLVDTGLEALKTYEKKAPSFSPERRRFLKYCAGLVGAGVLSIGPVKKSEAFLNIFQKRDWKAHLMSQDLIRGPNLLIVNGRPNDSQNHLFNPVSTGMMAVDYEVSVGTPIVSQNNGRFRQKKADYMGGNELYLLHRNDGGIFGTGYAHLDSIIINKQSGLLDLSKFIAFSGDSGYFNTKGEQQPPHLHFELYRRDSKLRPIKPGLDAFNYGIDGGRPVYWDTKTEIGPFPLDSKQIYIERLIDNMQERVKKTDIDAQTKNELLKRRNPEDLRNYLEKEVLQKHQGKNGEISYKYLPGHFMYSLMLEVFAYTSKQPFIAMLPFPHPMLLDFYKKENPNVSF